MTTEQTTQNNKLIAEFMGEENIISSKLSENWQKVMAINPDYSETPAYHTSWDWLMPVVEKIESLGYWSEIFGNGVCFFIVGAANSQEHIVNKEAAQRIEAVYEGVVKFIDWYNRQQTAQASPSA